VDLILCWFVAPIGLLAATVGLSLLVERLTGLILPWTLRPALGMAAMIVIAQFGTATEFTAKLTLPAILIVAILGLVRHRDMLRPGPGATELWLVAVVFGLYATPFLFSEVTWAGFIKLDDNATWLAITDHVFNHGRGLTELPPSTHQQVLEDYLAGSYPIGGFVPMAFMSEISGQDIAYTIQSSMAVAAAMLALVLFELSRRLLKAPGPAFLVAVVAPFAALLLGYYLWGGVKELVVAVLLPLGPILAGIADRNDWPRRAFVAIGITVAALVAVLGAGGALWAVPPLIPALIFSLRRYGAEAIRRLVLPIAVVSIVLVLPVIFTPTGTFDPLAEGVTGEDEIGNLVGPLNLLQAAGTWPTLDFRFEPGLVGAVKVLSAIVLAIAALSLVLAWRLPKGEGVPLVGYVAGGLVGGLAIMIPGSTWVDAKVLATLSPAMLASALIGITMIGRRTGYRLEAGAVSAVVVGVVALGAFLAYQGAWLAPRDQQVELSDIGARFAGDGPTLVTEVSGYGPRYFLRDLDPEGASDRRRRQVLLTDDEVPEDGQYVDLDEVRPDQLDEYNLIVTRRGPSTSRPTAEFSLVSSGEHFDVWKRRFDPGTLVEHLPLGTALDAGDVPPCSEVGRMADAAGQGGSLVAAEVGRPIAIGFKRATMPDGWETSDTYTFAPDGSGRLTTPFEVPGGQYELWLGGVVFGGIDVIIDGEEVASERGVLNNYGGLEQLATIELKPGEHELSLVYHGGGLQPGSAVDPYEIGPLELREPQSGDLGLLTVDPADYRELCGERWDWVEAYSG
jgi:hypothetical protein